MFTGIVESTGKVVNIRKDKGNINFTVQTDFADELKIDQSLCHDGVCLTVVSLDYKLKQYVVTAVQETLNKTNLGIWDIGYEVNLERSMTMGLALMVTLFRVILTRQLYASQSAKLTEAGNSFLNMIHQKIILL